MRAFLLDGYVDEPACFGVPPYISPYVRYCAGTFLRHGWEVDYATCDAWRAEPGRYGAALAEADVAVVIMGMTVPGRYRGGAPLTLRELRAAAAAPRRGRLVLAGPVLRGYALRGGIRAKSPIDDLDGAVDHFAFGDPEASLDRYLRTGEWHGEARRDYTFLDAVAAAGADIVRRHPAYPHVVAEMELSRGCDRTDGRCSFCTEGGNPVYEERAAQGILREAAALDAAGVAAYRFGRCANLLAWGGAPAQDPALGIRPNPARIEALYAGFRAAAPHLRVLHADNCNPLTVVRYPDAAQACMEAVARHNTEGDGLSLGLESLDPEVKRRNGLKVTAEEALFVVRRINEVGAGRRTPRALPSLLPGLNFVCGLAGERKESPGWNRRFLETLLEEGLIVRRINIRRAVVFADTPLGREASPSSLKERDYRRWKEWVRGEVDPIMIARVAPEGTLLRGVVAEERAGNVVFGRQLGSYPPLVGIVSPALRPGEAVDVMVTDHGGRSLTGVVAPLDANACDRSELAALPGIGKARAARIVAGRPYASPEDLRGTLSAMDAPDLAARLLPYFQAAPDREKNGGGACQTPPEPQ